MKRYLYYFSSVNKRLSARVRDETDVRGVVYQRVFFLGGLFGTHDLQADEPERVAEHWRGYCEANGAWGTCLWTEDGPCGDEPGYQGEVS